MRGKTEKPQRIDPTSLHTFYYKFPVFFFFSLQYLMSTDKKHKKLCSYSKSSEIFVELNSETEGSYFQRRAFVGFKHSCQAKKEINKMPTAQCGNAWTRKSLQKTLASHSHQHYLRENYELINHLI